MEESGSEEIASEETGQKFDFGFAQTKKFNESTLTLAYNKTLAGQIYGEFALLLWRKMKSLMFIAEGVADLSLLLKRWSASFWLNIKGFVLKRTTVTRQQCN